VSLAIMRPLVNISLGLYDIVSLLLPCLVCQRPSSDFAFGEGQNTAIQGYRRERKRIGRSIGVGEMIVGRGRRGNWKWRGHTRHDDIVILLCLYVITPRSIQLSKFEMTMINDIMVQLPVSNVFISRRAVWRNT